MIKIEYLHILICLLLLFFLGAQTYAAMQGSEYNIWIDSLNPGGGDHLESGTGNYSIDSGASITSDELSSSANFTEKSGFSAIEDEPTVGFNVQSVTLNFGELSPTATATSSHTLSAYTNSYAGYRVKVYGTALNSSEYTIDAIGSTPETSQIGTEQFGLNLKANTSPNVGAEATGGSGYAATNYNTSNNFAYSEGDTIAQSSSFTYQTDFTVSVIVNISEQTPAGAYSTTLTYEFIPIF